MKHITAVNRKAASIEEFAQHERELRSASEDGEADVVALEEGIGWVYLRRRAMAKEEKGDEAPDIGGTSKDADNRGHKA